MEYVKGRLSVESGRILHALGGSTVAALVALGVAGSLYKLVAPDGWGAFLFGRGLAGGVAAILTFIMMGTCIWLTREFVPQRQKSRVSVLCVGVLAAAGTLYLVQFCLKGAL